MEVLLLATEARRATLAGEIFAVARIATSMGTIRWDKRPALVKTFLEPLAPSSSRRPNMLYQI